MFFLFGSSVKKKIRRLSNHVLRKYAYGLENSQIEFLQAIVVSIESLIQSQTSKSVLTFYRPTVSLSQVQRISIDSLYDLWQSQAFWILSSVVLFRPQYCEKLSRICLNITGYPIDCNPTDPPINVDQLKPIIDNAHLDFIQRFSKGIGYEVNNLIPMTYEQVFMGILLEDVKMADLLWLSQKP
ncbi:MAG: hypothetical protein KDC02_17090 [Flavobacteriales bacterium]|nr:hypothetical protein [Flavobacteriales bacterium]